MTSFGRLPTIGIVYEEPNPETYAGVRFSTGLQAHEVILSGHGPTVDYLAAGAIIFARLRRQGIGPYPVGVGVPVMHSSSVDHFIMDGGELQDAPPYDDATMNTALDVANAYDHEIERSETPE